MFNSYSAHLTTLLVKVKELPHLPPSQPLLTSNPREEGHSKEFGDRSLEPQVSKELTELPTPLPPWTSSGRDLGGRSVTTFEGSQKFMFSFVNYATQDVFSSAMKFCVVTQRGRERVPVL